MTKKKQVPPMETFRVAEYLYLVVMTTCGRGCGRGSNVRVLCRDIETAVLVADGLEKVIPRVVNLNRGGEHIDRRFSVKIEPVFREDAAKFIEGDRW